MVSRMSDLEVAIGEVRELGGGLRQLAGELRSVDSGADYSVTDLAHGAVVEAMNNFRESWDDNRAHLADKLDKLGTLAREAADGFSQADEDLARQILDAMESE